MPDHPPVAAFAVDPLLRWVWAEDGRWVLATYPHQQGFGSAVLAPVLDAADRTGTAAWLETMSERNVGFYARLGFAVAREVDLPGGGPRCWLLHREPQGRGPTSG